MPKSRRGGKANYQGNGAQVFTMPQGPLYYPPGIDDDDDTTATPPPAQLTKNRADFMAMTEDERADAMDKAMKTKVPVFLANNDFQKITYGLGLNDKPTLVDDTTLDKTKGTEIFRTVNATKDPTNRIKYDADEIATQIVKGSVTRVSDSGGSAYGRGLYFATDYGSSSAYGNTYGNVKQTAMVRGKINSNAKIISYRSAMSGWQNEINKGSKLGKLLSKCDYDDKPSIYALCKGYDVVDCGGNYQVVLNRGAITMSKDIKATNRNYKW